MCGRFTLRTRTRNLVDRFLFDKSPELDDSELVQQARYNIAPTQEAICVRQSREGRRTGQLMKWGLVPSWSKDPTIGARLINARAETVAEKPSFRKAFQRRRCLVLADGYYEWQKRGKQKQPYFFRMRDDAPFAFAGLWEVWGPSQDQRLFSFTIITTRPNRLQAPIHDRMPAILHARDYDQWLDRSLDDEAALQGVLLPYEAELMVSGPVNRHVNNARNDDAQCIEPVELPEGDGGLGGLF